MIRILVADDEPYILRSLSFSLHREGHEVTAVRDGEEAVTALTAGGFDLAFLDVMMPKLDGFEVVRRLQREDGTLPIKVIFLTAKGMDEDRDLGMSLGASAWLSKPFSPAALNRLVLEFCAANQSPSDRPAGQP